MGKLDMDSIISYFVNLDSMLLRIIWYSVALTCWCVLINRMYHGASFTEALFKDWERLLKGKE